MWKRFIKNLWSIEHFTKEKNNSNILPSRKLPLPLANDFKKIFINKIDEIMRDFRNFQNSEDFFSVLAPVTIEQTFTCIKQMNKTFCRNDAFGIKTFDSVQIKKVTEYFATFLIVFFLNPELSLNEKKLLLFDHY